MACIPTSYSLIRPPLPRIAPFEILWSINFKYPSRMCFIYVPRCGKKWRLTPPKKASDMHTMIPLSVTSNMHGVHIISRTCNGYRIFLLTSRGNGALRRPKRSTRRGRKVTIGSISVLGSQCSSCRCLKKLN